MYVKSDDTEIDDRLNRLLALNAATKRRQDIFRSEAERQAYLLMRRPQNFERSFAILGGFLGSFPPASIYLSVYFSRVGNMGWFLALFVVANIVTALVGYYLGAVVGKIGRLAEKTDWITQTVFLTFVGGAWGAASGFVGGLFIFIFGAIFAAFFGLMVGAAALPVFAIFYRILNVRGYIDRRQLIPLAAGISLTISALIFGR